MPEMQTDIHAAFSQRCRPPAEVFKERQQQGQSPSSTDLVQAVKPFGRSSVPDAVKAELLAKLTDFIA